MMLEMHGNGIRMRAVAPVATNGINGMTSMYMPIKALNTFSRDWKI